MTLSLDRSLVSPGDRVLVAVSGGADSLALLHALAHARHELGIEVVAAHVHHGMRGDDADDDARFLEDLAHAWELELALEHADVPGIARERRFVG